MTDIEDIAIQISSIEGKTREQIINEIKNDIQKAKLRKLRSDLVKKLQDEDKHTIASEDKPKKKKSNK